VTAYGWVHIKVRVERPHKGTCEEWEREKNKGKDVYFSYVMSYGECEDCYNLRREVEKRVWEILEETGLYNELFTWYDDMGGKHKECTVEVELIEPKERKEEIVKNGNGYKVVYEGLWTWVYFDEKPSEEVRKKLKEQGFRFSSKRKAWYKPERVEISI